MTSALAAPAPLMFNSSVSDVDHELLRAAAAAPGFMPQTRAGHGRIDTLAGFRRTVTAAGAEDVVVAVVTRAETLTGLWSTPLAVFFLDSSHTDASAQSDLRCWAPHLAGLLRRDR
jgi:hypothetical protein